jgi:hypothetical protein
LDTDQGRITQQEEMVVHIEAFYKKLFHREERGRIRLSDAMWQDCGRLSVDQQQ